MKGAVSPEGQSREGQSREGHTAPWAKEQWPREKGILKQELGGANPTYLAVLTSTRPLAQLQGFVQFNKILLLKIGLLCEYGETV